MFDFGRKLKLLLSLLLAAAEVDERCHQEVEAIERFCCSSCRVADCRANHLQEPLHNPSSPLCLARVNPTHTCSYLRSKFFRRGFRP